MSGRVHTVPNTYIEVALYCTQYRIYAKQSVGNWGEKNQK